MHCNKFIILFHYSGFDLQFEKDCCHVCTPRSLGGNCSYSSKNKCFGVRLGLETQFARYTAF